LIINKMLHKIKTKSFQLQVPLSGKVLTLQPIGFQDDRITDIHEV
jgi:hypothetical protein